MAKLTKKDSEVAMDRRTNNQRQEKSDRRKTNQPVDQERRTGERRTKVARRRQIDPTTCERDYTGDEIEFMQAMDEYKRRSGRMFPTCSEILEVIRDMGYIKQAGQPALPATFAGTSALSVDETEETLEDEFEEDIVDAAAE